MHSGLGSGVAARIWETEGRMYCQEGQNRGEGGKTT
jgi:hypothetical protein